MKKALCIVSFVLVCAPVVCLGQSNIGDIVATEFFEELFLIDDVNLDVTDVYDSGFEDPSPDQIVIREGIVFGTDFDEIYQFDLSNNTGSLVATLSFVPEEIALDQNGDFVLADTGTGISRVDAVTGDVVNVYDDNFFSPDDLVVSANGDIFVAEFFDSLGTLGNDGIYTPIGNFGANTFNHLVIGNDGFLYATTSAGNIHRIHPLSGESVLISDVDFAVHDELAVALDGTLLLSASIDLDEDGFADNGLFKINPITGQITTIVSDLEFGPFFSLDDVTVFRELNQAVSYCAPTSYIRFRGIAVGGGDPPLSDFTTSDDVRARWNPGFVLGSLEAPVWLDFEGNCPDAIDFLVESQSGTPGLSYTVEAFNYTIGAFEEIGVQDENPNTDVTTTFAITSDHIDDDGSVRARVGWRKTGFTVNFPWEVRVDRVGWTEQDF